MKQYKRTVVLLGMVVLGLVSVSYAAKLPRGSGRVAKFIWKKLTCERCMGWGKVKEKFGGMNTCPKCGGEKFQSVQVPLYVCEICNGSGGGICIPCQGRGWVIVPVSDMWGNLMPMRQKCMSCLGSGKTTCLRCGGLGCHE